MKKLQILTLIFLFLFSLNVSANHDQEFVTASVDVDTERFVTSNSVNEYVSLFTENMQLIDIGVADSNDKIEFELLNHLFFDQIYYLVYSATNYNVDIDPIFFDSRVPSCNQDKCTYYKYGYTTDCTQNYIKNGLVCNVSDGNEITSFVYDFKDNKFKRVNFLKQFGKSDEYIVKLELPSTVQTVMLDGEIVSTDYSVSNFLTVSSDQMHDLTIKAIGYEDFNGKLYLPSELTTCSSENCIKETFSCNTRRVVSTDITECDVNNALTFFIDDPKHTIIPKIEFQEKSVQYVDLKTSAYDIFTNNEISSVAVNIGNQKKMIDSTFSIPMGQETLVTYSRDGYDLLKDSIYVDSQILDCEGQTCTVSSNGFTTTGTFNAQENAWMFTAKDINDVERSYVYDLDDSTVKRVVEMTRAEFQQFEFVTASKDVNTTNTLVESLVIIMDENGHDVVYADGNQKHTFFLNSDTIYHVSYMSEGYGSDTDVLYVDSRIPTCLNGQCTFVKDEITTKCDRESEGLSCSTTDALGETDYFVYDFSDWQIKRINHVEKNSLSDQFIFGFVALNNASNVLLHDFTATINGAVRQVNFGDGVWDWHRIYYSLHSDFPYVIEVAHDNGFGTFEPAKVTYYLDSRLESCGSGLCELDDKGDGFTTSCDGSDCVVSKNGEQISAFSKAGTFVIQSTIPLKPVKADYYKFKTSGINEFGELVDDDLYVEINGNKVEVDEVMNIPAGEAFGLKYTGRQYEDLNDFLFVDKKIITCSEDPCILKTNEFTTIGHKILYSMKWNLTVQDDNGISRNYIYDAFDSIVKRVVSLDTKPGADIIKPYLVSSYPGPNQVINGNTPLIRFEVKDDQSGVDFEEFEFELDSDNIENDMVINGDVVTYQVQQPLDYGTHTIEYWFSDNDRNDINGEFEFTVNRQPISNPTASKIEVYVNEVISFTANANDVDGQVVSYLWYFADNIHKDSAENPSVYFSEPGEYTVSLTVTDNDGGESISYISIKVNERNKPPVANIRTIPDKLDFFVGDTVKFIGFSSNDPDGEIVSFNWEMDGVFVSDYDDNEYTFTKSGDHVLKLTVTDDDGATGIASVIFNVIEKPNQPPVSVINANATTIFEGQTIKFDSTGSFDPELDIESFEWDFGDGSTSNELFPEYTYTDNGNFVVKLTVTDGEGLTGTDTIVITVNEVVLENQPPVAVLNVDRTEIQEGDTIYFNAEGSFDSDGSIVSYLYEESSGRYTNGKSDGEELLSLRFFDSGIFSIKLTVTDNEGANDTDIVIINVSQDGPNQPPVAVITADKTHVEVGEEIQFDGTPSYDDDGFLVYGVWDFGDGNNDTSIRPKHTYDQPGQYDVTFIVFDNDGANSTDSIIINVSPQVVNQPPVVKLSADKTSVFIGEDIQFTGSNSYDPEGDFMLYAWDFGDGQFSLRKDPIHSFSQKGSYDVTLTLTDIFLNVASKIITIEVKENQAPTAVIDVANTNVFENEVITFDGRKSFDVDGNIIAYFWNFGDGSTSNAALAQHKYEEAGVYTVTLNVADDKYNENTESIQIFVNQDLSVKAIPGLNYDAFVGETIIFDGSASTGNIANYYWDFGDGYLGTGSTATHKYLNEGIYDVILTVVGVDGDFHTATTKAIINSIEEPKPTPQAKPKRELTISRITALSTTNVVPGSRAEFSMLLENTGESDMNDVKISAYMPELSAYDSTGYFDLNEGDTESKNLMLDIPEYSQSGSYLVKFSISQGGEQIRTKYRYIDVN